LLSSIEDYRLPDRAPDPPRLALPGPVHTLTGFDAGLPANIDAEKTILGAILLDNHALKEAQARLAADDFSLDSHRRICLRMIELADAGHAVDIVTLAHELAKHGEVEFVGGVAYLASLTEGLPRRPVIEEYLRIVKDKSLARRLMTIAAAVTAEAQAGTVTSVEVIDSLLAQVSALNAEITWRDPSSVFVNAIDFACEYSTAVDWVLQGIIQRNGNGIIAADGKAGKSLLAIHLCLHLAAGVDWMGVRVSRPVSCGIVSREDDPGETARRIASLVAGCGAEVLKKREIDQRLWLNTRAQTPTFTLENTRELNEIIAGLKARKVEFAVFDVFRSIWTGNENDAQETGKVLESLRRVQREVGCACCLLHHLRKSSDSANIFGNIRGTTALRGWQEWGLGITVTNPNDEPASQVRCIRFETKAAMPHGRLCYAICGPEEATRMELRESTAKEPKVNPITRIFARRGEPDEDED
jgi:replicative DNA helicase